MTYELKIDSIEWGELVEIVVGKDETKFVVHEGLLRQHSAWFTNRLNGNWGNTKSISLSEAEEETFALFVEFLYRNQLVPPHTWSCDIIAPKEVKPAREIERDVYFGELTAAKLYAFADYFQCLHLKCAAIDAFREATIYYWSEQDEATVDYVYQNTPEGCGLRRFIIDYYSRSDIRDGGWQPSRFCRHQEFMAELLKAMFKTRDESGLFRDEDQWQEVDPCEYHDHGDSRKDGDGAGAK